MTDTDLEVEDLPRAKHVGTPAPSAAYDGCNTDAAINHTYKTLVLQEMKKVNGQFLAPAIRNELQEDLRRAFVRLTNGGSSGEPRTKRVAQDRPTSGLCEHCGEPTKGGKFVAGHDAKLKGDLIRAGAEGDVDAVVEAMFRNWYKPGRYPDLETEAFAVVQAHKTDEWLAARVAARLENLK